MFYCIISNVLNKYTTLMRLATSQIRTGEGKTDFYENLVQRAPTPIKALLLNLCKRAGERGEVQ